MPPSTTSTLHPATSLCELARQIATGEITSQAVVSQYVQRIQQASPSLNAVVQPRLEEALIEAETADLAVAEGRSLGPLHGVPVTIKDCFAVRGLHTTLGIHQFTPGPDSEDSPLVARLKAAGAIALGKTNVSQGMLLHECCNPRFGRTVIGESDQRSPGGSSGGEAAAVAAGLSPLGLASDLGGSTRQPAHSCGVVGFKPTSHRLTAEGSQRAIRGMKALTICPGPITRSVADADLAMRVLCDPELLPYRPDERPALWPDYQQVSLEGIRVAYWTDNGIARPAVGIEQAVHQAAQVLRDRGAEVRQVPAYNSREMLRIYLGLISADGLQNLARLLKGKPAESQIVQQARLGKLPRWFRLTLAPLLDFVQQPELSQLLRLTGPRSAASYWQLTAEADQYRQNFWQALSQSFDGKPVDLVLNAPHTLPALRHNSALHLLLEASHCYLANLLDAPAGVVPCGRITPQQEASECELQQRGWSFVTRLRRQNAKDSAGLPIGVQVMARPWRDDLVLAAMASLEQAATVQQANG